MIISLLSFTFFLFPVTFFLLPVVSSGIIGELVVAGLGVGDLDSDDCRIAELVHVLVHLELQSRPELERSSELVVRRSSLLAWGLEISTVLARGTNGTPAAGRWKPWEVSGISVETMGCRQRRFTVG
jgi:hypothetical protein